MDYYLEYTKNSQKSTGKQDKTNQKQTTQNNPFRTWSKDMKYFTEEDTE